MAKFVTENNWPNAKVVAMFIGGSLIALYVGIAPMFGLPMIDQQVAIDNLGKVIEAVVIIVGVIAYIKRPHEGDGTKEVTK